MEKYETCFKSFENTIDESVFVELIHLYQELFEDADIEFFKNRIYSETNLYSVLAYQNNLLIGFKIGYSIDNSTFYSWIGGVKKEYRNKGIASQLAKLQETYAIENGYSTLKTKSMNRFKEMMILNLKNQFNITKIYTNTKGQTKIVFEKFLK